MVDAAIGFATSFSTFVEALEEVKTKFPECESVSKLQNLANAMLEVYKECEKPDEDHFESPHEHFQKDKEGRNIGVSSTSRHHSLDDDEDFNPEFW